MPGNLPKGKTRCRDKDKTPYPYTIKSVELPSEPILKRLTPLSVIQFFRIELLLRSKAVVKQYESGEYPPQKLLWRDYHIPWNVLEGEHHGLLDCTIPDSDEESTLTDAGIVDLGALESGQLRTVRLTVESPGRRRREFRTAGLIDEIESKLKGFAYLRIDLSYPPTVIKNALDSYLTPRFKQIKAARKKLNSIQLKKIDRYLRKQRPSSAPFKVKTWLEYLRCYDLKQQGGYSDREIGERVYSESADRTRKLVVNAVSMVGKCIRKAEQYLPPFDIFRRS